MLTFIFVFTGVPPPINWTKNSHLVADHVAAGSFESAARLLHDQVGIVNFKPYENLFMGVYSASRTVSTWQSNIPPSFSFPLRNWKDLKNGLPAISVKLNDLVARLQVSLMNTMTALFFTRIEKFHRSFTYSNPEVNEAKVSLLS